MNENKVIWKDHVFEIKEVISAQTFTRDNDIYIEFLDQYGDFHYCKAIADHAAVTYQGHLYGIHTEE